MTEMLRLIRENKIRPETVESVDVGTNRNMPNALIHHRPQDCPAGKFSMEFCMASLLLYGKAGLNEFTDEVVNRPDVQAHDRAGPLRRQSGSGSRRLRQDDDHHRRSGSRMARRSPAAPISQRAARQIR